MGRGWRWLWARCPGIGAARLRALEALAASHQISLAQLWTWPLEHLAQSLGWPAVVMDQLDGYRRRCGARPDLAVPVDVLLPGDPAWPEPLDGLESPPLGLFHRGNAALLPLLQCRQTIAVVGTRAPSEHGRSMADRLGRALGLAGWPVLSGLADGIDAAVHRGCLAVGGAPIAVLGTHLDRVYPTHHHHLQTAVAEAGLLLSERGPDQSPRPGHFAARNRLIVALASAVVIVECPERSGALISARHARAMNCPVWVVPADACRRSARGSNALLAQGAAPLLDPEVWVAQLGPGPLGGVHRRSRPLIADQISDQQLREALDEGGTLDELQRCLGRSAGPLAHELVQLELQGLVVCESGQRWRSL
ncbi:MAG: DNA-processing protein DprA [Synechococcus sp.]